MSVESSLKAFGITQVIVTVKAAPLASIVLPGANRYVSKVQVR